MAGKTKLLRMLNFCVWILECKLAFWMLDKADQMGLSSRYMELAAGAVTCAFLEAVVNEAGTSAELKRQLFPFLGGFPNKCSSGWKFSPASCAGKESECVYQIFVTENSWLLLCI